MNSSMSDLSDKPEMSELFDPSKGLSPDNARKLAKSMGMSIDQELSQLTPEQIQDGKAAQAKALREYLNGTKKGTDTDSDGRRA